LETLKILATFVNKQKPLLKTLQKNMFYLPAEFFYLTNPPLEKGGTYCLYQLKKKLYFSNARSTPVKTP